MAQTSMANGGWNAGNMSHFPGSQWSYPQNVLSNHPGTTQPKLPAIGSERRQTTNSSPIQARSSNTANMNRPPSWQDEIGATSPKSPIKSSGSAEYEATDFMRPMKVFPGPTFNHTATKSRSSSTPASEAVRLSTPGSNTSRLRHLSMSTSSSQPESRDMARSTIQLTKFPPEFVPYSMRPSSSYNIPEEAVAAPSFYEDTFAAQIPGAGQTSQGLFLGSQQRLSSPKSPVTTQGFYDPGSGLMKLANDPPREVNFRETRDYAMPPPRSESPGDEDDFDEDLSKLTQNMGLQSSVLPADQYKPAPLPPELETVWGSDDTQKQEREYFLKRYNNLLHTETPPNREMAHSMGLSHNDYEMLKMRDVVRKTIPDSTFPFFNGEEIDDRVYNYPPEVQKAYLQPPPLGKNQYAVVTFKHHRAEVFVVPSTMTFVQPIKLGDMVVVQADRGENVGQVWHLCENMMDAERVARGLNSDQLNNLLDFTRHYVAQAAALRPLQSNYKIVSQPGWVIRRAESRYLVELQRKEHDETKAKRIAAGKAVEMGFPLEILDTEFQIDHQKLTIYYISSEYVRFKELVNNIYKIYKMRIWMSSINPQHPPQHYGYDL